MPRRIRDLPEEYVLSQRALARSIGARLRVCREALDLTQEQLRARLEVEGVVITRTQYSRLEVGKTLPSADELIALRAVFRVTFDWLLLGEGRRSQH
jgi:transcriptional regulator with XRE-family HTH domain